jgi:uncharacterized protein involved in exopolysaccharide biosynthesis
MFFRDLIIYARILRKRWRLIVALFIMAVGTTTVLFLTAKPVYQAWIKLQVVAPPPSDISLYSGYRRDDFWSELTYAYNAFVELLGDGSMAWRTISKVETKMEVEDLLEQTIIEADPESSFISVGVSADTPEQAQLLVTTLVEETLKYYGGLQARPTTAAREFISQELESARKDLVEAERALMQFKIENRIGSLGDEMKQKQDLILALLVSRDHAQAKGDKEDVANYDRIIAERQRQLQDLVSLSTDYESLVTTVDLTRETYNLFLSKETEAKIKENQSLRGGFIQVISPAQLPQKAAPAFSPMIILLSGVLSLIVGVMLAFVWEYAETQLPGEAERTEQAVPAHLASVAKSS